MGGVKVSARTRIWGYVNPELNEKLETWAVRLGLSKAQLINISIQAGLSAVTKAISPEEAISPDILAKIMLEAQKLGVEFKEPENEK